uniref:Reverse transcriptase zinc-binding domain-containing protein n=1 Tax=Quercus lobata TaxID=97700 RepID=A0A7N2L8B5_QUELO
MNFKELSKFNEAMLAKQVWRLIHDKESLFYRVFRAKFFPLGDIFSAQVKSGSYAWRSILSARKVVAARARWRICNGLTTRIYSDCWLRGAASGKISSQISDIPANAVVADLFEENSGWWNGVLIDQYFSPFEAQKIKSIPVCITPQEDILIWPKTRDGKYSVKTGYQLLREMENSELASSLDSGENKKFWTVKRKVVQSPTYSSCSKELETVFHALWSCENIGLVWGKCFEELRAMSPLLLSFVDLFGLALQNSRGAELFYTISGIGVVVRNSLGEVLAALSEIIPLPLSIVVLETIAARRAVTFLQELGLGQFYL